MEKYEFKYYRKAFAAKLIALAFLLGITTQIIGDALAASVALVSSVIVFIGGIGFIGLGVYALLGANAQGVAILHDEYVEIKLKDKEYQIYYDKIVRINDKFFTSRRWHIRINGESTIVLRRGSGFRYMSNVYPLEKFMRALYKRLKPAQYY